MPPTGTGSWWVVGPTGGPKFGPFTTEQSPTRPPDTSTQHTYAGPFSSHANALAWISQHQGHIHLPSLPNPFAFLAWLQEVGHFIGLVVAYITDGPMWRSIGWIVLGFIFLLAGVIQWVIKGTDVKSLAELGALIAA